jgi:acetyl esterase/lipase
LIRLLAAIVSLDVTLACSQAWCARTPEPLDSVHLEAVHAQRIEWLKKRGVAQQLGIYQDFRAVTPPDAAPPEPLAKALKNTGAEIVFSPQTSSSGETLSLDVTPPPFPGDAAPELSAKQLRGVEGKFKQYPDEVYSVTRQAPGKSQGERELTAALRNTSVHILARDFSEAEIRTSLAQGHYYWAHDWLCDPEGFLFVAETNLGVFDIGDTAPVSSTRLSAALTLPAKLKLFRDGVLVKEAMDSKLVFPATAEGDYHLEAWLSADGEDKLWIRSGKLRVSGAPTLEVPTGTVPGVEIRKDIPYTTGGGRLLDLYLPAGARNFPMLVFLHGGTWRSGDRTIYAMIGNRFASAGIGVAIPSYRGSSGATPLEDTEDAAAAFAWVFRNAAQQGGDPKRIYLGGHSAGAQLAALLALDGSYLSANEVPATAIRGVVALSGMYDSGDRSPLKHIHAQAPPFFIAYCQWDYLGLPRQARDFAAALRKGFAEATLAYIPGESHISEILNIWKDDDPTARAILNFVK